MQFDQNHIYRIVMQDHPDGTTTSKIYMIFLNDDDSIEYFEEVDLSATSIAYPMKSVASLQYKYNKIQEAFESEIYQMCSDENGDNYLEIV